MNFWPGNSSETECTQIDKTSLAFSTEKAKHKIWGILFWRQKYFLSDNEIEKFHNFMSIFNFYCCYYSIIINYVRYYHFYENIITVYWIDLIQLSPVKKTQNKSSLPKNYYFIPWFYFTKLKSAYILETEENVLKKTVIKGIIMQNPGGKRLANSKSGLKIVSSRSCDTSPWELAEPQWVLDSEVNLKIISKLN